VSLEKNREENKVISNSVTSPASVSVFKSKEGRQRIIDQYNKQLSKCNFSFRERSVDTSYGATYILESGPHNLPPLLLFHGSTSNSAAWFADIKELTQCFHVFSIDLIGDAGQSAEIRLDMKSEGYAMWIRELFEKLGLQKASIMGNSLGAWMCLKFASIFPEKVERIVLLAASGIAPIRASFVLRLIFYSLRGGQGGKAIIQMVYGKDQIPEDVIDYLSILSENYSPYTGQVPVLSNSDLTRLVMPVLYIPGADDQLTNVPKSAARLKKLLPQPTIDIRKNTGHVIYNVLDKVMPLLQEQV
jgi:pimeloyl-ACP methyl ester carboxylesterase